MRGEGIELAPHFSYGTSACGIVHAAVFLLHNASEGSL